MLFGMVFQQYSYLYSCVGCFIGYRETPQDSSVEDKIQKIQNEFTSQIFNQGAELQRKQFALLNNIIQNQVEFSSQILSSAWNIINDNAAFTEKKTAKSK